MKAWLLLGLMVASTVLGDVLQSMEMKRHGEIRDFNPRGLGKVAATLARRKYLILAVDLEECRLSSAVTKVSSVVPVHIS